VSTTFVKSFDELYAGVGVDYVHHNAVITCKCGLPTWVLLPDACSEGTDFCYITAERDPLTMSTHLYHQRLGEDPNPEARISITDLELHTEAGKASKRITIRLIQDHSLWAHGLRTITFDEETERARLTELPRP
jgi:hypothetical protein